MQHESMSIVDNQEHLIICHRKKNCASVQNPPDYDDLLVEDSAKHSKIAERFKNWTNVISGQR